MHVKHLIPLVIINLIIEVIFQLNQIQYSIIILTKILILFIYF